MTSIKTVRGIIKTEEFPIKKIRDMFVAVGDDYTDLRHAGLISEKSKHHVDGKLYHDCFKSTYSTKVQGFNVSYVYKFCSECRKELDKHVIVFNDVENVCYIIKK